MAAIAVSMTSDERKQRAASSSTAIMRSAIRVGEPAPDRRNSDTTRVERLRIRTSTR